MSLPVARHPVPYVSGLSRTALLLSKTSSNVRPVQNTVFYPEKILYPTPPLRLSVSFGEGGWNSQEEKKERYFLLLYRPDHYVGHFVCTSYGVSVSRFEGISTPAVSKDRLYWDF